MKKQEYNGWTGKLAKIAKQADRWSDKVVKGYGRNCPQASLLFWGYMQGYQSAMRKKRKK